MICACLIISALNISKRHVCTVSIMGWENTHTHIDTHWCLFSPCPQTKHDYKLYSQYLDIAVRPSAMLSILLASMCACHQTGYSHFHWADLSTMAITAIATRHFCHSCQCMCSDMLYYTQLASRDPWRIFNIRGNFPLHKRFIYSWPRFSKLLKCSPHYIEEPKMVILCSAHVGNLNSSLAHHFPIPFSPYTVPIKFKSKTSQCPCSHVILNTFM